MALNFILSILTIFNDFFYDKIFWSSDFFEETIVKNVKWDFLRWFSKTMKYSLSYDNSIFFCLGWQHFLRVNWDLFVVVSSLSNMINLPSKKVNQQLLLQKEKWKKSESNLSHNRGNISERQWLMPKSIPHNMVDAQARNYSRSALETHDFNHDGWLEQLR